MRQLCLLASALLLGAAEPTKPNFVFVLIDDMGWGDFSCFGNTEAKTLNIDRGAPSTRCHFPRRPCPSPSRTPSAADTPTAIRQKIRAKRGTISPN